MNATFQSICLALTVATIGLAAADTISFTKKLVGKNQSQLLVNLKDEESNLKTNQAMMKEWKKTGKNKYTFIHNNEEIGTMAVNLKSLSTRADCTIGDEKFTIKRIGFWKNAIEVTNDSNQVIAKVYPEKWFANTSVLEYKNQSYNLSLRNNPQAEYVIKHNDKEVLAYGLDAKVDSLKVRISTVERDVEPMFDYLLWYLFMPILIENSDDNYLFFILLVS